MVQQSTFDTVFKPLWTISFWNFWPGHCMKFTGRMKASTLEDGDHCFKYCLVKICSKIIVKPLAKKSACPQKVTLLNIAPARNRACPNLTSEENLEPENEAIPAKFASQKSTICLKQQFVNLISFKKLRC
jgi:hypothetical protein